MLDVQEIAKLQETSVANWHREPINNPYSGLMEFVCQQHIFNFRLWHEEDIARSPEADDAAIAQVKRNIDKLNQQRNDWIEKVDDCLTSLIAERSIHTIENAPINTETPGSVIDRLSILALRIFHLEEQFQRPDTSDEHRESVGRKIAICRMQKQELCEALQRLLNDIASGTVRHRTYRQFKMYNDPALNPYLYNANSRQAA